MKDITIKVNNLVKAYKLYATPIDRVKESLKKGSCYHKDFYAVNDISFEVKRGETVGIIGKNGAGKSTLLKMITGVLTPTSGNIELSGTVSALLELGSGFDSERNGIDNIYLNGRINGLTKEEIDQSLESILEFADIGDFINQPIKTYSSGMLVRLAFAVAVNVKPEILIVDEALSVGDVRFQQKCYRKIREFKQNGTVLFVSHDTGAITSFCDRVIWIDNGRIYKIGEPREIIEEYLSYMRYDVKNDDLTSQILKKEKIQIDELKEKNEIVELDAETEDNTYSSAFGTKEAQYTKISLLNKHGNTISQVTPGEEIQIKMEIKTAADIESPILGFTLKDMLGNELVVTNTVFENIELPVFKKNETYIYTWQFTFPYLHAGDYPIDIAMANGTYQNHEQLHYVTDALILKCVDKCLYQEGRGRYILPDVSLKKLQEVNNVSYI